MDNKRSSALIRRQVVGCPVNKHRMSYYLCFRIGAENFLYFIALILNSVNRNYKRLFFFRAAKIEYLWIIRGPLH